MQLHIEAQELMDNHCSNTKSDVITVTEDKLENILMKYEKAYKIAFGWITQLSLSITFLLTISTVTFTDKHGLSKGTWEAMYIIAFLFFIGWTIKKGYYSIFKRKKISIEHLIGQIKNQAS